MISTFTLGSSSPKVNVQLFSHFTDDKIDFKPVTDYHISLTRVVVIKYDMIRDFTKSVRQAVANFPKQMLKFKRFQVYVNEERTRTFLGLEVSAPDLDAIVDNLDLVLEDHDLEPFYEKRSYHVSLLWALGDQESVIRTKLGKLQGIIDDSVLTELGYEVDSLECKCGNKIFQFQLT